MPKVVSIPVDKKGKRSVNIEVADAPSTVDGRGVKMGVSDKVLTKTGQSLEEALGEVGPAIEALRKMAASINGPKEISLEIGLKLTAKAGVVLASADAEGSIKVTLKWVT